jgi:hypothetical protein
MEPETPPKEGGNVAILYGPDLIFGWARDKARGEELARKIVEENLLNQPTHLQREQGFREVSWGGWELPSEKQLSLMTPPKFVEAGGLMWNHIGPAERMRVLKVIGAALHHAGKADIWDFIDAWMSPVKLWLAAWQAEINAGTCWQISGRFGAVATALLEGGAVLASAKPVVGFYGNSLLSRDEHEPGKPGSPQYVQKVMGQRYLDWLSAIA